MVAACGAALEGIEMRTLGKVSVVLVLGCVLALAGCESKTYVHSEVDAEYVVEEAPGQSTSVPYLESTRSVDTRGDKTIIHEETEAEVIIEEDTSIW